MQTCIVYILTVIMMMPRRSTVWHPPVNKAKELRMFAPSDSIHAGTV